MAAGTHHSPPECIGIAAELGATIISNVALLSEVDKVRGKDESKEADVQCRDQLLQQSQRLPYMYTPVTNE